jgi:hypothetical protein
VGRFSFASKNFSCLHKATLSLFQKQRCHSEAQPKNPSDASSPTTAEDFLLKKPDLIATLEISGPPTSKTV